MLPRPEEEFREKMQRELSLDLNEILWLLYVTVSLTKY